MSNFIKSTMKPVIRLFVFLFFAAFFSCSVLNQDTDNLRIENDVFTKSFQFNTKKAGKIQVEYKLKKNNQILTTNKIPYFEFVLNGQLISSNDQSWIYKSKSERKMTNGGTEYVLQFEGTKEPVDGLQIKLYQQVFPQSSLMREKLELHANDGSFRLNKLNNKLHFKFPGYSIQNSNNNPVELTEIRMASFEKKPITFGDRKKGNHMYYPDMSQASLSDKTKTVKGPVSIISNGEISWLTAYEHASQDDLKGMLDEQKLGVGNLINDAMQGTKGVFSFPVSEDDFRFLGISSQCAKNNINVSVDIIRGGYLDGEIIDNGHSYSTVWTATGFYPGDNPEDGKEMIRNYLFNQICEKPASRTPEYYYNTWGLQRNDKTKPLRGILTYDRIFEEIEYAAELGVDIFVLDDGWENAHGEWFPNKERLNKGLAPIKERLDKYGMKLGLWFSPMGIDSTTRRYKEHPEWVIKDSEGNPIAAQWGHPAFDFVSGFFDLFIDDCKKLIDEGCRFMKWDAINTFYSDLPNLKHGSDKYSPDEVRARYEYLLPVYVTRAMEILTDYEPGLVIEIDLTEARRCMVGLAPISQGKLFWMNNGASWYNDYSTYRSKSMRIIASEFAGIIPLELFTYANYPQNITGNMKYNVNNSLLAGHGFWGNLQLMNETDRKWAGNQVKQSKKVLPFLVNVNPTVEGKVGDSPEIYSIVNSRESAGQVIVFSEEPVNTEINTEIMPEKMLAALNSKYSIENKFLKIPVDLQEKESSVAIIILPNDGTGVSIVSSTSEISSAELVNGELNYMVQSPGEQRIIWDKKNGKPVVKEKEGIEFRINEMDDHFEIAANEINPRIPIVITSAR